MKKIVYLLLLSIIITSCISGKRHLEIAKKHLALAELKGAYKKTDTTFAKVRITIDAPEKDTTKKFEPVFYDAEWNKTIQANDSLVKVIDSLKAIHKPTVTQENQKKKLENNFKRGFEKDSVYYFKLDDDAIISLTVNSKAKSKYSVNYHQRPTQKVIIKKVPVKVDNDINIPWLSVPWWFWVIIAVITLAIIAARVYSKK